MNYLIAIWIAIGAWLTFTGLRSAWPVIRADRKPLPIKAFGVVAVIAIGPLWLPARFIWALYRK